MKKKQTMQEINDHIKASYSGDSDATPTTVNVIDFEIDKVALKLDIIHEGMAYEAFLPFTKYDQENNKWVKDDDALEKAKAKSLVALGEELEKFESHDIIPPFDAKLYFNEEKLNFSFNPPFVKIEKSFTEDDLGLTLDMTVAEVVDDGFRVIFYLVENDNINTDNIYRCNRSYSIYDRNSKTNFVKPANKIKQYGRISDDFGIEVDERTPEKLSELVGRQVKVEVKKYSENVFGQLSVEKTRKK